MKILSAARVTIHREGLARTTTRAIAREAGISEPTLYKYFADKRDLIHQAGASFLNASIDRWRQPTTFEPDAARRIIDEMHIFFSEVASDEVAHGFLTSSSYAAADLHGPRRTLCRVTRGAFCSFVEAVRGPLLDNSPSVGDALWLVMMGAINQAIVEPPAEQDLWLLQMNDFARLLLER